ncbi:hypothetical protein BN1723_009728 [Verticillium longisporum]|uniref:Uncharacterized protein n=1 Tax=Verticillium longisporum TaxID=100787 RepID=A0A0G4KRY3_VERLO|nr:hypothetical protein BN1723_009728 [Verticillium longisporum]
MSRSARSQQTSEGLGIPKDSDPLGTQKLSSCCVGNKTTPITLLYRPAPYLAVGSSAHESLLLSHPTVLFY